MHEFPYEIEELFSHENSHQATDKFVELISKLIPKLQKDVYRDFRIIYEFKEIHKFGLKYTVLTLPFCNVIYEKNENVRLLEIVTKEEFDKNFDFNKIQAISFNFFDFGNSYLDTQILCKKEEISKDLKNNLSNLFKFIKDKQDGLEFMKIPDIAYLYEKLEED